MGMFDKETQLKNAPFGDGEFVVWGGTYLGSVKSAEYGDNTKAIVQASADDNRSAAEDYVVFGVMAEQIRRIADGDLPAVCRIGQDGRANIFQMVRKLDGSDL